MKALTVLSVLLLSTNISCYETSYLAKALASNGYQITSYKSTIILENTFYQHWVEVFIDGEMSCVIDEGETL